MPATRAIRYKSGPAPAHALLAFSFNPYCFASAAATHIVHATLPSHFQSLPNVSQAGECRCPSPVVDEEKGNTKTPRKKNFLWKIGERPGHQSNLT
jgi:hypothetical protein